MDDAGQAAAIGYGTATAWGRGPALPTAREMLLAYDAQRPRSQQAEIGMSALGGCRRRTAYQLHGVPPDEDYVPDAVQPILGTAIHVALAAGARLLVPGVHAESLTVRFAGLLGHPDAYHDGRLRDFKTLGFGMQLESRKRTGPLQRELWQVSVYAAALIVAGHPVHTIEIDYIARDSGEEFLWSSPFRPDLVVEAMDWLRQVREGDVDMQPRDYRPDSQFCKGCEFFRRCWQAERGTDDRHALFVDDPDAAAWMARLEDARARRRAAEDDEKDARGALDHLRSVSRPGEKEDVRVPGEARVVRFTVSRGRTSFDKAAIVADYARAGAEPPVVTGSPVIGVALVPPEE